MGKQSRERRAKWAKVQEAREIEGLVKRARLFDLLRGNKKWVWGIDDLELVSPFFDELQECVVIDAQGVNDYILPHTDIYKWWIGGYPLYASDWKEYLTPKPLYDDVFIEWQDDGCARNIRICLHSADEQDGSLIYLIYRYDGLNESSGFDEDELKYLVEDLTPARPEDDENVGAGFVNPKLIAHMVINSGGGLEKIIRFAVLNKEGKESYDDIDVFLALLTISLANSRNITQIEVAPSKNDVEKFTAHFGVPMTKYKTLAIKPMSNRTDRADQPQQQFDVMPLHLRRGNFAHYTDDAPLFGKYTGTFWRPATVVGNEKNGIVAKDYKVSPPDEPS